MSDVESIDPGNAALDDWSEPLSDDELTDLLDLVDNPDALVTAGLAETLYDDPALDQPEAGESGGR